MLILLTTAEAWILYGSIVLGAVILISIVLFLICGLRSRREKNDKDKIIVDEAFISSLLLSLGGIENIKTVSIDNGRVKFVIEDLDLLNQEIIKQISASGAFISGKNVKLLFKYDSKLIVDTLLERGVSKWLKSHIK